jgi:thioredoxin:protein disulfide reductase
MKSLALLWFSCAIGAAIAPSAHASGRIYELGELPRAVAESVQITAYTSKNMLVTKLDQSSSGHILIKLQIELFRNYHLYKDKTRIEVQGPWVLSVESTPRETTFLDPVTKTLKMGYTGQAAFTLKASLPEGTQHMIATNTQVPLFVDFQACSDTVCLLPIKVRVPVPLLETSLETKQGVSIQSRLERFFSESIGRGASALNPTLVLILFLAGLLTAFTPCVYPLYPITIGIFSHWASGSKKKSWQLALLYALGLVLTYSVVGLVTAASGAILGSLTQTPVFLISAGVLILLSALVFSGRVNLKIFDRLQAFFGRSRRHQHSRPFRWQALEALGMGVTLGLVASPCVGPVLVVLLASLSKSLSEDPSRYFSGFVLLSSFGVGMAAPVLMLGQLILRFEQTPKWSRYTPLVKNIGTFLMILAAFYYLVPGVQMALGTKSAEHFRFAVKSYPSEFRNRPSVVDFRADWCAACLELEHKTFSSVEVSKLFENESYDYFQVDLTDPTADDRTLAERFDVVGLPTVLILDSQGRVCSRLFGFEPADEFLERLKTSEKNCQDPGP